MNRKEIKEMLKSINAEIMYEDTNSIEIDSQRTYGGIEFIFNDNNELLFINAYD